MSLFMKVTYRLSISVGKLLKNKFNTGIEKDNKLINIDLKIAIIVIILLLIIGIPSFKG